MLDALLWTGLPTAFVLCFLPTFQWLHVKYTLPESYFSHGYLIPFVTAYLIAARRPLPPRRASGDRNLLGLLTLVLALGCHTLGTMAAVTFVSGFSMVFYVIGTLLFLFGWRWVRHVLFPLCFLFLLCPVPDRFVDLIAIPVKSVSTDLALAVMRLLHIPYYREGFVIQFAASQFVVGTPCNGLRSLLSLAAIGLLFVYLLRPRKRWLTALYLCLIPALAVLLNGCRIAVLFVIADRYGEEAAAPDHYLHETSGLAVFLAGLLCLLLLGRVLHGKK